MNLLGFFLNLNSCEFCNHFVSLKNYHGLLSYQCSMSIIQPVLQNSITEQMFTDNIKIQISTHTQMRGTIIV